jgi:hypothetical protein
MVRRSKKTDSTPPWLREQAPLPESFGLLSTAAQRAGGVAMSPVSVAATASGVVASVR